MNFTCKELEGCLFQPSHIIDVDNYWIIPACKKGNVTMKECKLIFAYPEKNKGGDNNLILFMLCYQFLFSGSAIYNMFSSIPKPETFSLNCTDIAALENVVKKKYDSPGGIIIDFRQIESRRTRLPDEIDFIKFNRLFSSQYNIDTFFKDTVKLFLYTIGFNHKLYDNILQKIAQLQTIFESLVSKPKSEPCPACKLERYKEEWDDYMTRKLKDFGVKDSEIEFIIKIKKTLNKAARVKYVHNSSHLNTSEKMIQDIKNGCHYDGQNYWTTDFDKILKMDTDSWAAIDWLNVFDSYQTIVKKLIYISFLKTQLDTIANNRSCVAPGKLKRCSIKSPKGIHA